ncbi:MAG: M48 family metallopeptidase [Spirochaetota bacterium]
MHPLIDRNLQKKAKLYENKKEILQYIEIAICGTYLILFYLSGLSQKAASFAAPFSMPVALFLYSIFIMPLFVLLIPVSFFKEYVIEKRFGLSTQSISSWLLDQLKGFMLCLLLGYPVALLLFFFFIKFPGYWWAFGIAGLSLLQLFILIIFPLLIFPLFFTHKPLEDKELVNMINKLFEKAGMRIRGVYSFNLSTKSKKENAAIAGLWRTRRILISDTLLERREKDEVLVVLAHELGHHIKRHMIKLTFCGLSTSCVLFYIVHRIFVLFPGFPHNFQKTLTIMPLFIIAMGAFSFPLRILTNAYSRTREREADAISIKMTGKREAFINLMAGLSNSNLIVAYPKKYRVILFHSHPPVGERIEFAETMNFSRCYK